MNVGVLLHVALLMESLPAKLTWVRSRVRVYQQMGSQSTGTLEPFAALLALEHLLRGMHGSVLRQTDLVAEGFVAELAGEGSLAVVRSPCVHLKLRLETFLKLRKTPQFQ